MPRRLVLASASPARLFLLRTAGLNPEVMASSVDEDDIDGLEASEAVLVLAERKARAVAERIRTSAATEADPARVADPPLVVGCDSLLEFDQEMWGKPSSPEDVIARWRRLRGSEGLLHTGHFLLDTADGRAVRAPDTALVRFGSPTDAEIDAYARTSEALAVAGPFTLEGRSSPWIDSIDGNYGTITGISLPVLRRLLSELGVELIDLWS